MYTLDSQINLRAKITNLTKTLRQIYGTLFFRIRNISIFINIVFEN